MPDEQALPDNMPVLPPAPPRESLISTAVKFLQNPKVTDSPLDEKKQFLAKKGLSDEEISIAITRAGVPVQYSVSSQSQNALALPHAQSVSVWTRIRQYSAVAVILGGVFYGIYYIYKRFIEPILLRSSDEQQEKLERMEEGVRNIKEDLGQNMQEIRATMQEIQEKLSTQSIKLNKVSAEVDSSKIKSGYSSVSTSSIGELKAEITSIKGLLLSRNQFPSQPILKSAIPSWQLKPNKTEAQKNIEEGAEDGGRDDDENARKSGHVNGFESDDLHVNGSSAHSD